MALHPIKYVWASSTTNKNYPKEKTDIENGILYEGEVVSNQLNGIEEVNQYAIRELQTTGGYYDNNQIYNLNNVVFVLVNDGGNIKQRFYICKQNNTTGTPPITQSGLSGDISIINLSNSYRENTNKWELIGISDRKIVSYSTSGKYNYRFWSNTYPKGTLKIKTYDSSGNVTCSFEVTFLGDNKNFNIRNVVYSDAVRTSANKWGGTYIGHPGFCVFYNIPNFGLSVYDNTFCKKIEIDYTDFSFISPSVTQVTFVDTNLYAVREGGGTYIPNLGDIHQNLRNNVTASNGDTYSFYLFSRGCVPFSTAIVLNTNIYHQWNNGGMPSVNIDVSDCYLVNKGSKMGQTNAVKLNEALPNITGTFSTAIYTSYDTTPTGAFKDRVTKTNYYASGNFNFTNSTWNFKASNSNTTYQDGAPVRGKCLVTSFLLQAF